MDGVATSPISGANAPEFTPSQLGWAVKRALETGFEHVRVRGEVSDVKRYPSGHIYFTLKDVDAALSAVIWRGAASRIAVAPEQGLEVVATGRVSAYAKTARVQVVVEGLEIAGEGALLKLLEQRRKALAAEGLFDADRKRDLPLLPRVIGVVTSPRGAVIRDILHRLNARCPRPVLVWPTPVQGDGAAPSVAAAIRGFDAIPVAGGLIARPDLLIVARGGGSVEDLWTFNEEIVVRAVADCRIPVISAIGHETDTTLIDFAADLRAPTPTGAAEMAAPVRAELLARLAELEGRIHRAAARRLDGARDRIAACARPLERPERLLDDRRRHVDALGARLPAAMRRAPRRAAERLGAAAARLSAPDRLLAERRRRLATIGDRLRLSVVDTRRRACADAVASAAAHADRAARRRIETTTAVLAGLGRALKASSYRAALARGYGVIRGEDGQVRAAAAAVKAGERLSIAFHDGAVEARAADGPPRPKPKSAPPRPVRKAPPPDQGSLL